VEVEEDEEEEEEAEVEDDDEEDLCARSLLFPGLTGTSSCLAGEEDGADVFAIAFLVSLKRRKVSSSLLTSIMTRASGDWRW